jgi:hypothetical protein
MSIMTTFHKVSARKCSSGKRALKDNVASVSQVPKRPGGCLLFSPQDSLEESHIRSSIACRSSKSHCTAVAAPTSVNQFADP